jgi:hypothetical protein
VPASLQAESAFDAATVRSLLSSSALLISETTALLISDVERKKNGFGLVRR